MFKELSCQRQVFLDLQKRNNMKIGIVCYPTYGGSGVVATELGKALAKNGNEIQCRY